MDNQHRKIDTYRELGMEELEMIQEIKQAEAVFQESLQRLSAMRQAQLDSLSENEVLTVDNLTVNQIRSSRRSIKQSRINLKQASMWATTAIAIPSEPVVNKVKVDD